MATLSNKRPLFHSEADFQFALAQQLAIDIPGAEIRLEYRPSPDIREYVDLWFSTPTEKIVIELKYWTKKALASFQGETFSLNQQGAQDICRYDYIKDICRVQRLVDHRLATEGYVVALTNDPLYWKKPKNWESTSRKTVDHQFRLHEGRVLAAPLAWQEHASAGTVKGREKVLRPPNLGSMHWRNYSELPQDDQIS